MNKKLLVLSVAIMLPLTGCTKRANPFDTPKGAKTVDLATEEGQGSFLDFASKLLNKEADEDVSNSYSAKLDAKEISYEYEDITKFYVSSAEDETKVETEKHTVSIENFKLDVQTGHIEEKENFVGFAKVNNFSGDFAYNYNRHDVSGIKGEWDTSLDFAVSAKDVALAAYYDGSNIYADLSDKNLSTFIGDVADVLPGDYAQYGALVKSGFAALVAETNGKIKFDLSTLNPDEGGAIYGKFNEDDGDGDDIVIDDPTTIADIILNYVSEVLPTFAENSTTTFSTLKNGGYYFNTYVTRDDICALSSVVLAQFIDTPEIIPSFVEAFNESVDENSYIKFAVTFDKDLHIVNSGLEVNAKVNLTEVYLENTLEYARENLRDYDEYYHCDKTSFVIDFAASLYRENVKGVKLPNFSEYKESEMLSSLLGE